MPFSSNATVASKKVDQSQKEGAVAGAAVSHFVGHSALKGAAVGAVAATAKDIEDLQETEETKNEN